MRRRVRRWLRVSVCLVSSIIVAYVTFFLAWNPTPRFVFTILPGAYIGATLNRFLKLPWSGAGPWTLFFSAHIFFWFIFFLTISWALSKIRSRWWPRREEDPA